MTLIGNGTETTIIERDMSYYMIRIIVDWVNLTGFNITNNVDHSGIELNNIENVSIYDNVCSNNTIFINFIPNK